MRVTALLVLLSFLGCEGARILGLTLYNGRSHWISMEPLFRELAARGHQVTVFTPFPQKRSVPNYTDVDFSGRLPPLTGQITLGMIKTLFPTPTSCSDFMYELHEKTCVTLEEPEFQKLLGERGRYDLVVTEIFGSDCFTYIAHKLQTPLVSFVTSVALPWISERTGLPDNPAYVPSYYLRHDEHMDLWQRTLNTLMMLYSKFTHLRVFAERTRRSTEARLGGALPPLREVVANTSLVLLNSYHALSQSRPFPPNVIEVGGIHIKERKPLPKDVQEVVDSAKHGLIVMSFGSLVNTASLPESTILMFMRAFAKIPQTILFKYDGELSYVPPNVIIKKWLPQRDLVEHERVVALVGHGGLHSTIEAVQFGKPLVGVPFFGDQPVNVAAVARRGAGVALDIDSLTQEDVERALDSVVNDSTYKENMRQLSLQFRDRPMSPLDTAVFWVEYVIRHRGARHLRPASVDLPFYQYLLLDVASLLATALAALLYLAYFLCKRAYALFSVLRRTKMTLKDKKIN